MTNINVLIKQFVESRRYSREERKAAYELACLAADLYQENLELKEKANKKRVWLAWN